MKVILVALGVLFSLQVFAQNTVSYTYDSAGNRVARTAPRSNVASTSSATSNHAVNQTDFAILLRKPAGENLTPSSETGVVASTSPVQFQNGQLNCFVVPMESALPGEVVLPATNKKQKSLLKR